jgi:hypothetical protein
MGVNHAPRAAAHHGCMSEFAILSRIERIGRGRYLARVSGIPCGVAERCAPEERSRECGSFVEARGATIELAKALAHDIRERGNRVMRPQVGPACAFSTPAPHNERRSLARAPEEA